MISEYYQSGCSKRGRRIQNLIRRSWPSSHGTDTRIERTAADGQYSAGTRGQAGTIFTLWLTLLYYSQCQSECETKSE